MSKVYVLLLPVGELPGSPVPFPSHHLRLLKQCSLPASGHSPLLPSQMLTHTPLPMQCSSLWSSRSNLLLRVYLKSSLLLPQKRPIPWRTPPTQPDLISPSLELPHTYRAHCPSEVLCSRG